jgi:hypothetical protein
MDPKTIVIIVLLLFGWYWYSNPSEGHDLITTGVDKVKSVVPIDGFNLTTTCPETVDPVCGGDNITYQNSCLAGKAGVETATQGECIEQT